MTYTYLSILLNIILILILFFLLQYRTKRPHPLPIEQEPDMKLIESHALRRTIIDSLPIGLIVVDADFKIVALNRPFCGLFNITAPIQTVVGQNIFQHQEPILEQIEEKTEIILRIFADEKPYVDEIELQSGLIFKRNYYPYFDEVDGTLKWHLLTFEDITESKWMEREIIAAKEEAEEANMAKSMFLSKMSHELRTPLNGILGFSQLLETDPQLQPKQQRLVGEILKGGRHLLSLINEILDLTRIETGKITIQNNVIHIGTVVKECINLIGHSAEKTGIVLSNEIDPNIDYHVYVDEIRLKQILLNLLDNAIKYNRENGKVTISCSIKDEIIYVYVHDTGKGIPLHEQERIFEPFYRIAHEHIEGAGLGLSLVRQLVHLMGGEVGVESPNGGGSTFWISFPLADTSVQSNQMLMESKSVKVPDAIQYKILYIEDNPMNLDLVKEILGGVTEITLLTAMTGQNGLQMAKEHMVDLILLDLNLPDLDGYQVFEKLKSNAETCDIPVIAVSAYAMQADIDRAMRMGISDYITKPIDILTFIKVVTEHLAELNNRRE